MATANVTRATKDNLSPIDQIDRALTAAHAMSVMVVGEGLESFQCLNDKLQGDYLFALYERIEAARVGFDRMLDEREVERAEAARQLHEAKHGEQAAFDAKLGAALDAVTKRIASAADANSVA